MRPTYNITMSLSITLHLKNLNQVNNFDLTMYECQVIRMKLTAVKMLRVIWLLSDLLMWNWQQCRLKQSAESMRGNIKMENGWE
jgi:hypothetical protein